jgi:spore maturation protein CgeB
MRNELLSRLGMSYYERYRVQLSKRSRGKISQELLPVLYSSARINLNVTLQDAVDWDFWNLRPLEIMACGGLLMTDRLPSLEREFEGGAVFTDGGEDMISKIEEYLQDDAARECVSRKGKELVHESHSIKARASDVYDYLQGL